MREGLTLQEIDKLFLVCFFLDSVYDLPSRKNAVSTRIHLFDCFLCYLLLVNTVEMKSSWNTASWYSDLKIAHTTLKELYLFCVRLT